MPRARQICIYLIVLSTSISVLWGLALNRSTPGGIMGFPGIYYGTRCLMHHCDPYNVSDLESLYRMEGHHFPTESIARRQSVTLYVNLPTTFLFVAPFALLPLEMAQLAWSALIVASFVLAAYLVWSLGARHAPLATLLMVCVVLANSEIIFAGGNTAGFVVSLCVVAVWCFLEERFVPLGIVCLAISLAMKPHDGGLVWLYFLLAGGLLRKRALQTLALTTALAVVAVLWVSWAAPHWMSEMRTNLSTISAPNGINDPGPHSIGVNSPDMIIDMQTVISVFVDHARTYNLVTYAVCAAPLLLWLLTTIRSRFTPARAWLALAAIAPLTMLFTYHRSYDAKLILLCLPACAVLWSKRDALGWIACLLTTAAIFMIGDIPLALVVFATKHWHLAAESLGSKAFTILLARPAPILLFLLAIFYLWAYVKVVRQTDSKDGTLLPT